MRNKVVKLFTLFSVLALVLVLSPTLAGTSECDGDCYDSQESSEESAGSAPLLNYVRVTSPNGGETLGRNAGASIATVASDTHKITWDSLSAGVKMVDILYSLDMGTTWHEIVLKHENTQEFDWKLPNINATPVLLRVSAYNGSGTILGSDLSNSPFSILNHVVEPTIVTGDATEYQFQFVGINSIAPVGQGGVIEVNAVIKNTGQATWHKDGSHPIHLGTVNPNDRISSFYHESWLSNNRPAQMMEDMVLPGQVATFRFTMKAPSMPGIHTESFAPVVENLTWMNDDTISWDIQVV